MYSHCLVDRFYNHSFTHSTEFITVHFILSIILIVTIAFNIVKVVLIKTLNLFIVVSS